MATVRSGVLMIVLLALGGRSIIAQCPDGTLPPCTRTSPPPATSVAVLTFVVRSPDSTEAYLGEQLADEITGGLGGLGRLVVKSRQLVRGQERALAGNPAAIGRTLRTRFLVEGLIQREGRRLRVRTLLVRAADGVVQWSQAFSGSTDSLLDLEEFIARDVAEAIAGRLLPVEVAQLGRRPTTSNAAYRSFLQGNARLAHRTRESLAAAALAYESALRSDPSFTRALARVAYVYALHVNFSWDYRSVPPDTLLVRGLATANRAISLDSASSDAWMARGYLLQLADSLVPARSALRRAVELDPRNAEAWHRYGRVFPLFESDAALAVYYHALALDPDRPVTMSDMAFRLVRLREPQQALFWTDSALALDSAFIHAHIARALARLMAGDTAGARADLARFPPDRTTIYGYSLQKWTQDMLSAALRARLATLGHDTALARREATVLAIDTTLETRAIRLALVDDTRALDVLEQLTPSEALWELLQLVWFDGLRGTGRFQRLLQAGQASVVHSP